MIKRKHAIIAGIATAVGLASVFGYLFFIMAGNFDYSKVRTDSGNSSQFLTDEMVRRAVDSAFGDIRTRFFVAQHDDPSFRVYVTYLEPERVKSIKDSNSRFSFLPESSPVIALNFDSGASTAVPERPRMSVFVSSETYRIYGIAES